MVEFKPSDGKIVVMGQVINPNRAERLSTEIENALERKEKYESSELTEISVTEDTIDLLCGEGNGSEKLLREVGIMTEDESPVSEVVPNSMILGWKRDFGEHGTFVAVEKDISDIYEQLDCPLTAFNVRQLDPEEYSDWISEPL